MFKNKIFLVVFSTLLVATFVLAATHYGDFIEDYNAVINPYNVLEESNYALLEYTNNKICPPGDFEVYSPIASCYEKESSIWKIRSWEIIRFNESIDDATYLKLRIANFDDGCSAPKCGESTTVRTYYTTDYSGSFTNWTFKSNLIVDINETINTTSLIGGEDIDAVLIARTSLPSSFPDPRVYWVKVTN